MFINRRENNLKDPRDRLKRSKKNMKSFVKILNELKSEESVGLSEVLEDIFDMYVEETGDTDGEEYDIGLSILSEYADRLPEDVASEIAETLQELYFESIDADPALVEAFQKKSAAERRKAAKEQRMWRKTHKAAMKKYAIKGKKPHKKDIQRVKAAKMAAKVYN